MSGIPRVFHQIWVGGPLPDLHARWADAWRELHPEWEYVLWDDERIASRSWLLDGLRSRVATIAPHHQGQFIADLIRLEVLLDHGGVYLDTDMEPLRPLDELLEGVKAFAAWEKEPSGPSGTAWINTAVMGCTRGHPWMALLVTRLAARVERMHRKGIRRPNRLSGPHYVTPFTRGRSDVTVFPKTHFYPYLFTELDRMKEQFEDSYAVHHWNNRRRERGVPL